MTLDEWLTAPITCGEPRASIRAGLRARVLQILHVLTDYRHVLKLAMSDYWMARQHRLIQRDEVKKLRAILDGSACTLPPPTLDDYNACDVAKDLALLGRLDDAKKLLDEQAPRRHNVRCAHCQAPPGRPCRDKTTSPNPDPRLLPIEHWFDRVVPHWARIHCEGAREMRGEM